MSKKLNGYIKLILAAITVGTLVFNTAILWNDVKHLKADVVEVKQSVKFLTSYLLGKK